MSSAKSKKKKNKAGVIGFIVILIILVIAIAAGMRFYRDILQPNVTLAGEKKTTFLFIPTGSEFDDVVNILSVNNYLEDTASFSWVAKRMNYTSHVHAGRFRIRDKMNNYELVKMLRSNANVPVKVVLNTQATIEHLAGDVGNILEFDSAALLKEIFSKDFLSPRKLTRESALTFFIPNTYEFYWNSSPEDFLRKMEKEYNKFWNEERLKKAARLKLTPQEVSILASIVQSETNHKKEMSVIAGLYLNRLRIGMKLEADPTVTFLIKERKVLRVYKWDTEIESPYNTYLYEGLPPGPICFPAIFTIDAVLDAEEHTYLFMCAKADESGSHNFARTMEQHKIYARQYHQYLNKKKIR